MTIYNIGANSISSRQVLSALVPSCSPLFPQEEPKPPQEKTPLLQEVSKEEDFNRLIDQLKKENAALPPHKQKVLFIDFYTTWCKPCQILKDVTFADADVKTWLGRNAISITVDAEKNKFTVALAKKYGVGGYPSLIFLNQEGKRVGLIVGNRDPDPFLRVSQDIVTHFRNPSPPGEEAVDPVLEKAFADFAKGENLYNARQTIGKHYMETKQFEKALEFISINYFSYFSGYATQLQEAGFPINDLLEVSRQEIEKTLLRGEEISSEERGRFWHITLHLEKGNAHQYLVNLYDRLKGNGRLSQAQDMAQSSWRSFMKLKRFDLLRDVDVTTRVYLWIEKIEGELASLPKDMEPEKRDEVIVLRLKPYVFLFYSPYQVLCGCKRFEEADALLKKTEEKVPEVAKDAIFYNSLAWNAYLSGNPREVDLRLAQKALSLSEGHSPGIIDTVVKILWKLGREEEAKNLTQKSMEEFAPINQIGLKLESWLNSRGEDPDFSKVLELLDAYDQQLAKISDNLPKDYQNFPGLVRPLLNPKGLDEAITKMENQIKKIKEGWKILENLAQLENS